MKQDEGSIFEFAFNRFRVLRGHYVGHFRCHAGRVTVVRGKKSDASDDDGVLRVAHQSTIDSLIQSSTW